MSLSKDLVLLILQFLDEENLKATAHMLELETGYYLNMKYFEEMLLNGNWDEAERYLSGFTKVKDNKYSTKIYFEIRKQKFLEALDMHAQNEALDILNKDLKVFRPDNEELFKDITELLILDDIREHESLSMYIDAKSARRIMTDEIKKIVEANPILCDKLQFPDIRNQRLRRLINQSLNWQHIHCAHPHTDPQIKTLLVDHVCQPDRHPYPESFENNQLPSQDMPVPFPNSPASWTPSPSTVTHSGVSGVVCLGAPTKPCDATIDGLENSDNVSKSESVGTSDEVTSPTTHPAQSHSSEFNIPDYLPKTVARTLNEGSSPMTMDFHPVQQTVLLVGTNIGDIGLWEVISGEKLLSRNFKVWDIGACSMIFKVALVRDPAVSVNRVTWSPDGSLFGVAYSKHIVQLYSYHGGNDVRQQLEIDAHAGGVNDLEFSTLDNLLLVISCGDDQTIKVWDVVTGAKKYTFVGHEAPVYSVCPHFKEHIHFIFSTSVDGKIKAWLYDNLGARVDYDAPGRWCTTMAYSSDSKRLFSCGTSRDGESFLVEWIENEGVVKRTYQGLVKCSSAVLQFDTTKNQFLAAGDEHSIKFWDMDNVELLTTIEADGCLPARPRIRFNKDGMLLAVIANENIIKILATDTGLQLLQNSEYCSIDASKVLTETMGKLGDYGEGLQLLQNSEYCSIDASKVLTETMGKLAITASSTVASAEVADGSVPKNGSTRNSEELKSKFIEAPTGKSKVLKIFEINKPSQFQSLRLPAHAETHKISRLIYNNAGNAILALTSNATHLLWKWPQNNLNLSGKATTKVPPQLWQPRGSLLLMTNDITGTNTEAVACFAVSKNDSYVISASGGKVSLFNMMTFKRMATFIFPPPMATFLAFYPQDNNIIAIGLDDSTILIYNVRVDEVKSVLKGHSKRITGLAFSNVLNVLVSSGADNQIFVWKSDGWVEQNSKFLNIPDGRMPVTLTDTHIQFHQDQIHFLAVHETHLAIYETTKLECVKQWVPGDFSARISHATFSCDSQLVYASFLDGYVSIFVASDLQLQCHISPSAYIHSSIRSYLYPLVIAAHPQKPYQFALGLTDGSVYVIEPCESAGKWTPIESGSAGSTPDTFPAISWVSDRFRRASLD